MHLMPQVSGSPYQPGQRVRVVDAIDIEVYDVRMHIGKIGKVTDLYYADGSGYPDDPVVLVEFQDGGGCGFWSEEIAPLVVLVA
jgi:hypothetical protein